MLHATLSYSLKSRANLLFDLTAELWIIAENQSTETKMDLVCIDRSERPEPTYAAK